MEGGRKSFVASKNPVLAPEFVPDAGAGQLVAGVALDSAGGVEHVVALLPEMVEQTLVRRYTTGRVQA